MKRPSQRKNHEMRRLAFTLDYQPSAEGSVLVEYGQTKVICSASIVPGVPRFIKGRGQGWLTAEYGMLPRATHERTDREAVKGKQGGRTVEIQRLIGRALRSIVDLSQIGENTITVDCDVIQADGGTRTASITGGCVALVSALKKLKLAPNSNKKPFLGLIAAVSVGIYQGEVVLDLDYQEDSSAETDMNIIMNTQGHLIEVQGTAEKGSFSREQLNSMLDLACQGITQIHQYQAKILELG